MSKSRFNCSNKTRYHFAGNPPKAKFSKHFKVQRDRINVVKDTLEPGDQSPSLESMEYEAERVARIISLLHDEELQDIAGLDTFLGGFVRMFIEWRQA